MTQVHAELGSRAAGAFLDFLCCFVVLMFIAVAYDAEIDVTAGRLFILFFITVYFVGFTASRLQATPGKALAAIKVTDLEGNRIGARRSAVRFAALFLSFASIGLGFLLAAWTPRRQALHDLLSGTIVVDANATPEKILGRVAPRLTIWSRLGAVALLALVLMLGQVVSGFMADVKMREATMAMLDEVEKFRRDVATALVERRAMPPPPALASPHARRLRVNDNGTVTLEVADSLFPNGRFTYTPSIDKEGKVDWTCVTAAIEQKFLPSLCRD